MRSGKYWMFQHPQDGAKIAQQDITELTELASGLLAFERAYLTTHGERTPVFRLLSMINTAVRENIEIIERRLVGDMNKPREVIDPSDIPF